MTFRPISTLVAILVTTAPAPWAAETSDWPQWRGAGRDGRASAFKAPAAWPKTLMQKWKVTVGEGVASPALVGDRVYVFSRENGAEVLRCLSVADGKELWQDKYDALGASGPAQGFSGPRSSPAVGSGKVVTLGVRGMLSSVDAATGKVLWRKDEFNAYPNFHPSSSPLILGDLAVAQLGGRENGALVAYDLNGGTVKWKWSGPSPSYASPAVVTVDGVALLLAQTESKLVAVRATDGTLAWESEEAPRGGGPGGGGPGGGGGGGGRGMGGRDYRASSPVVDGATVYVAGRGVKALRFGTEGGKVVAKELWNNAEKSVQFNTPTLHAGRLFGLAANNELFCLEAKDGTAVWSAPFPGGAPAAEGGRAAHTLDPDSLRLNGRSGGVMAQADPAAPGRPPGGPGPGGQGPRGPGGPGGPGRRGMGGPGGGQGYGTLVDAGSVMVALTPAGQMVVFDPGATELKVVASYKVGEGMTHSYPVLSGNRILVKDKDSVTLWTVGD